MPDWLKSLVEAFLNLFRRKPAEDTPKLPPPQPETPAPAPETPPPRSEPVVTIEDPEADEDTSDDPTDPGVDEVPLFEDGVPEFPWNDHLIPVETGQAVSRGWTSYAGHKPLGVTWHWTATWDLATCRKILGGANALRKPQWDEDAKKWRGGASAHYGVGLTFDEGVDRYVGLENRSWHAGANQILRHDGKSSKHEGQWWSGARTTVGIETVNIGYARKGVEAGDDWMEALSSNGQQEMLIPPWPTAQVMMMIQVGKEIQERWPHLTWRDHHGHHDICPGFKVDVAGFPFAEVLRGIYDDKSIPDIWGPLWTAEQRQRALVALGYDLGDFGPEGNGVDGDWGRASSAALESFQELRDMEEEGRGMWTTFVCWEVYQALQEKGLHLHEVTQPPQSVS